ncbi:unnamed protein product, partial [Amoebophrya sp. A25]|eukprot:GSA25T00018934001.1
MRAHGLFASFYRGMPDFYKKKGDIVDAVGGNSAKSYSATNKAKAKRSQKKEFAGTSILYRQASESGKVEAVYDDNRVRLEVWTEEDIVSRMRSQRSAIGKQLGNKDSRTSTIASTSSTGTSAVLSPPPARDLL